MNSILLAFQLVFSGDRQLWTIIGTTVEMSLFSTAFSVILGFPLGTWIGCRVSKTREAVKRITDTMMSLPPVVAGLVVFLLFRSVGPFGGLHLLFSVPVMVIAQVILITPVVAGMTCSIVESAVPAIVETAKGLSIGGLRCGRLILRECAPQLTGVVLLGFGRSIAEVGAVSLVGGNIENKTRVMTTAILLEANRGDFDLALANGIILLLISLVVNLIAGRFTRIRDIV